MTAATAISSRSEEAPARPLLRWHGGKWRLAPWIIAHFPPHRIYVEPFGGAASVLLRKARCFSEVYNDLDEDVVNLFRLLRSGLQGQLIDELRLTPFARAEFEGAYREPADDIERARNLIIRSFMGYGSNGHNGARPTGFRSNSNRSGTSPAHDWANYPDHLPAIVARLQGVVIEKKPAISVMLKHDSPDTLHYVDPPYIWETRSKARNSERKNYRHELSNDDHRDLLSELGRLKGMVALSGYPSPIYEAALPGWRCVERAALADGARPRIEALWLNPAAVAALGDGPLFGAAA